MPSTPSSAKKSASTPKSSRKSTGTPKSGRKSSKAKAAPEPEETVTSPTFNVTFSSDNDVTDIIRDVERLAHYKPALPDIPEEDSEAHAVRLIGSFVKKSWT